MGVGGCHGVDKCEKIIIHRLDMVDPHDQMEITRLKWSKIASELNLSGYLYEGMVWLSRTSGDACMVI